MNTIVRSFDGHVIEVETVLKTIKVLSKKPGIYRIADIQEAINQQLDPVEYLTRKMILRSLVKILGERKIDS